MKNSRIRKRARGTNGDIRDARAGGEKITKIKLSEGQKRARILPPSFWERDTQKAAEELLGKFLVRKTGKKKMAAMITEVEVYDGFSDRASHASRGVTKRNEPMFGSSGNFYVYLNYGIHWMLNVVTREKGYPAAILIRGTDKVSGPGRLTKFFKITGVLNGKPAAKKSGLWFEDRGVKIEKKQVAKTPRIGVDYAGPKWAKARKRFLLKGE